MCHVAFCLTSEVNDGVNETENDTENDRLRHVYVYALNWAIANVISTKYFPGIEFMTFWKSIMGIFRAPMSPYYDDRMSNPNARESLLLLHHLYLI